MNDLLTFLLVFIFQRNFHHLYNLAISLCFLTPPNTTDYIIILQHFKVSSLGWLSFLKSSKNLCEGNIGREYTKAGVGQKVLFLEVPGFITHENL